MHTHQQRPHGNEASMNPSANLQLIRLLTVTVTSKQNSNIHTRRALYNRLKLLPPVPHGWAPVYCPHSLYQTNAFGLSISLLKVDVAVHVKLPFTQTPLLIVGGCTFCDLGCLVRSHEFWRGRVGVVLVLTYNLACTLWALCMHNMLCPRDDQLYDTHLTMRLIFTL